MNPPELAIWMLLFFGSRGEPVFAPLPITQAACERAAKAINGREPRCVNSVTGETIKVRDK